MDLIMFSIEIAIDFSKDVRKCFRVTASERGVAVGGGVGQEGRGGGTCSGGLRDLNKTAVEGGAAESILELLRCCECGGRFRKK